jgi:3-deoxy-D-manno-octulosonic-acid transferase
MFGPNTWNFRDVVEGFRNASACLQLQQPDQLTPTIRDLLNQTDRRNELGKKAQSFVQQQQGATQITANLLREVVNASRKV